MSNRPNFHARVRSRPSRPGRAEQARRARRRWASLGALAAVAATVLAVTLSAGAREAPTGSAGAAPLEKTGETNDMGMPVVATPGSASGTATAADVEVTGADWDMGRVPLNVAVRPTWTLRNTGSTPVTLGEPKAEVREGCCPGPLTLGVQTLAPGASTTLTFELSMHPGMDGPHDLGVHVPVQGAGSAADHLTLRVTGDFR